MSNETNECIPVIDAAELTPIYKNYTVVITNEKPEFSLIEHALDAINFVFKIFHPED